MQSSKEKASFTEQFDFMNDDEFKDEHLKWRHLTKGFSADEVKVASLLHRGKVVEAYSILWNLVRPFGREDAFYTEGKGE